MYKASDKIMETLTYNFTDSEIREMARAIHDNRFIDEATDLSSFCGQYVFKLWRAGIDGKNCHTEALNGIMHYVLKDFLEPSNGYFIKEVEESTLFKNYNVGETAKIEAAARADKEAILRIATNHGFPTLMRALYTKGYCAGQRSKEVVSE